MFTLVAACAFGLEALVKRELIALGYEARVVQPGRIQFAGDWADICRTNIWLRTADRVLIQVQQFDAPDFDALFETAKDYDWSQIIPADAEFPVTGRSRLSKLTSVPAIQRSVKKAIVESLRREHRVSQLPETGEKYKIDVALLNDVATLTIDTTGDSLHKRGYRKLTGEAPIKETLAAALIDLSVWKPERMLVDPFCGTGTIPIEAARIGMNIAPGLDREFVCSRWSQIEPKTWQDVREKARTEIKQDIEMQIVGTDIDASVLDMARYHAQQAGVESQIHFQQKPFADFRSKRPYGVIVTNPPYGERMEDHEVLQPLYSSIPAVLQRVPTWSFFLITNMPALERIFQKTASRRRKLFNGRIECTYFQFLGPRPGKDFVHSKLIESSSLNTPQIELHPKENPPSQQPLVEPGFVSPWAKVPSVKPAEVSAAAAGLDRQPELSQTTEPQTTEPQTTEPQTTEPQTPEPQTTEPQTTEPQTPEPQTPEPQTPEPQTTEPQTTEPQTTEKESASAKTRKPSAPVFGGLQPKDYEQAELFRSRLLKRARHLRRWPTRRGITCYRIYERDIPEIPLVVDRYEDNLHITEYERPHERDIARHAQWLELMKKTAASVLDVPIQRTHLKSRDRDRREHEKLDHKKKRITINEGGLKFLVNLTDYVDTGLFLDHRLTRDMVRNEAAGKRFLNLFAYTGSFSVYAAHGGAKTTTTVDLSKNYLDWAKANLDVNDMSGWQHQFISQDIIEFLNDSIENKQQFDLCVVDPPTFSNSKRTDDDWDLQTRHVELLNMISQIMAPDGVVYFSNNFRRFKFDESSLQGFDPIREISKQTVPEDFRNQRIHRCWKLKRKAD